MNKYSCEKIQSILIDRKISGLSDYDKNVINSHIENCIACHGLASEPDLIEGLLKKTENSDIKPKPETLIKLKSHLKPEIYQRVNSKRDKEFILWKNHYVAFAAVIIFFLVIFSVSTIGPDINESTIDSTYQKIFILSQPAIININDLNLHPGGKSIGEDSLLKNDINASM